METFTNSIYRFFLLGTVFAVLWVKEYLWSLLIFAVLLLVTDVILVPVISASSRLEPRGDRPHRRDDDEGDDGGESFREPKPRWSPRSRRS